jgi:hypothetical protein
MNMRSLVRLLAAAAPIGWLLSSVSLAGSAVTSTPSTPPPLAPAAEKSDLGVEASLGWDSHYIFRGELLQKNTAWTQISLDIPLTDSLSLTINPWFLQDIDNDYNEFDLNSAFTYSLESWEFSAGYGGYFYPRKSWGDNIGIGDEQEMTASVSRSLGDFNASLNLWAQRRKGDATLSDGLLARVPVGPTAFSFAKSLPIDGGLWIQGLRRIHSPNDE